MCWDPKVGLGDIVAILGLLSLWFAAGQFLQARKANRAKMALDILQLFNSNAEEKKFLYKLDYNIGRDAFRFSSDSFAGSNNELHLDNLLYKLSYVGYLLRKRILAVEDLSLLRSIAGIILRNEQVHAYLDWLRTPGQIPDHSSFADAIYLYDRLHQTGRGSKAVAALDRYVGRTK